ncbi:MULTISPECIES: hypothetical protein [unclassified Microbacterium]
MITLLLFLLLSAVTIAAVAGTVVVVRRDGYRPARTCDAPCRTA